MTCCSKLRGVEGGLFIDQCLQVEVGDERMKTTHPRAVEVFGGGEIERGSHLHGMPGISKRIIAASG
jgi:hypothetical protein